MAPGGTDAGALNGQAGGGDGFVIWAPRDIAVQFTTNIRTVYVFGRS